MKRLIFLALLFLGFCSVPPQKAYFQISQMEKIAKLCNIEPPPAFITFTPTYVISDNDSVCEFSIEKLLNVYNCCYVHNYSTFSNFLFETLNQKDRINLKNPQIRLFSSQIFKIDSTINRIFKEKGKDGLIKLFCSENNQIYTLNKGTLTLNKINSITYYFFINQYMRIEDDYYGTIKFKKLTSIIN